MIEFEFNGHKAKADESLGSHILTKTTKSGAKNFYLKCDVTGHWGFCHEPRFTNLIKRFGSVEALNEARATKSYVSNEGKHLMERENPSPKKKASKKSVKAPEGEVPPVVEDNHNPEIDDLLEQEVA